MDYPRDVRGRPAGLLLGRHRYIAGIVTDFFVDRMKFCGIDARHKLGRLERLLDAENYDLEKLIQFFDPNLHRHG